MNDRVGHPGDGALEADDDFQVKDRRHWQRSDAENEEHDARVPAKPTMLDEFRLRAEAAEAKLHEYIEAYKADREEQERFRDRLGRDVERRVELQFGELVADLLQSLDDLDLALSHVTDSPENRPLAEGVSMARSRFLATLEKRGIEQIVPDGTAFDPNEAEALRVDPVQSAERDGLVTQTLQAGYRLGQRVLRPARVAVGRHTGSG